MLGKHRNETPKPVEAEEVQEAEETPKGRRRRQSDQEEAVKNAHPTGHPDEVHKNLFRL